MGTGRELGRFWGPAWTENNWQKPQQLEEDQVPINVGAPLSVPS